jgi:hypothetical protein
MFQLRLHLFSSARRRKSSLPHAFTPSFFVIAPSSLVHGMSGTTARKAAGGRKRSAAHLAPTEKDPKKTKVENAPDASKSQAPQPLSPSKHVINFSGSPPEFDNQFYVNPTAKDLFLEVQVPSDFN